MPHEFEVIGVPYEERGARVSEHIEVIRSLWTQEKPEFEGRFTRLSGVQQKPMPKQSPHPPIIIGGMSPSAHKRAVCQGNGWYGFALSIEATEQAIAGLKQAAAQHARPESLGELELTVTPAGAMDLDTVRRFEDLGVSRLVLLPGRLERDNTPGASAVRFVEKTAEMLKL